MGTDKDYDILKVERGSVRIDVMLDDEEARTLIARFARGELEELSIVRLDVADDLSEEEPSELVLAPTLARQGKWKQVGLGLAVAASLLFFGVILDRFMIGKGSGDGVQILAATAEASFSPLAGPNEKVPQLIVESPIFGFVSVVTLAEGRRPLIYPRVGGEAFRIRDGKSVKPHLLHDDTTAAVFVVTQTPAAITLSESEATLNDLGPNDTNTIQQAVQSILEANGFRKMAFGDAQFKATANK